MRTLLMAAALLLVPRVVLACPVCFGNSDSPLVSATNLGIMALLGIVAFVLSGFAAFIVHLNRRARLLDAQQVAVENGPSLTITTPQEGSAQC